MERYWNNILIQDVEKVALLLALQVICPSILSVDGEGIK